MVEPSQRDSGVDVQHEHHDQPDAQDPDEDLVRQDRVEEGAQRLAVFVDLVDAVGALAQIQLEVADHVGEHETDEAEPGDRHHPLLADGGSVELHRPRSLGVDTFVHDGRIGAWSW